MVCLGNMCVDTVHKGDINDDDDDDDDDDDYYYYYYYNQHCIYNLTSVSVLLECKS